MGGVAVAQAMRVASPRCRARRSRRRRTSRSVSRRGSHARPRRVGKRGSPRTPVRARGRSQPSRALRAAAGRGTTRSLPPLPQTRTSHWCRSTSRTSRATSSPTRSPAPYSSSTRARSRSSRRGDVGLPRPRRPEVSPSMRSSQSSTATGRGRRGATRGEGRPMLGSVSHTPSRTRKPKNVRSAASLRDTLDGARRPWSAARKPRTSSASRRPSRSVRGARPAAAPEVSSGDNVSRNWRTSET
jgi:hypothetical protein